MMYKIIFLLIFLSVCLSLVILCPTCGNKKQQRAITPALKIIFFY